MSINVYLYNDREKVVKAKENSLVSKGGWSLFFEKGDSEKDLLREKKEPISFGLADDADLEIGVTVFPGEYEYTDIDGLVIFSSSLPLSVNAVKRVFAIIRNSENI